jgi:hypothetical protein
LIKKRNTDRTASTDKNGFGIGCFESVALCFAEPYMLHKRIKLNAIAHRYGNVGLTRQGGFRNRAQFSVTQFGAL